MIDVVLATVLLEDLPCACFGSPCWCAFWLILVIPMSFCVWRDAERRNQPGCLWALVILVFHIVGLLFYLIMVGLGGSRRR